MGKKFSQMITGEENSRIYKDPQEFMFGEEHTEASEVWSLGLRLFYAISGRDYFDVSGVPEDECFMMADPDSDSSLIIEKYIPDEYTEFAGLLKDATVFRRDGRISPDYFLSRLSEYEIRQDAEKTDSAGMENAWQSEETTSFKEPDNNADDTEIRSGSAENSSDYRNSEDEYALLPDYDYGIILNNRRSGRIEFIPLLFHDGRSESYVVPADEKGEFTIAVSRRHRDDAAYSNPSSVYGDRIIPVGLAKTSSAGGQKIKIKLGIKNGKLTAEFTDVSLSGAESGTRNAGLI